MRAPKAGSIFMAFTGRDGFPDFDEGICDWSPPISASLLVRLLSCCLQILSHTFKCCKDVYCILCRSSPYCFNGFCWIILSYTISSCKTAGVARYKIANSIGMPLQHLYFKQAHLLPNGSPFRAWRCSNSLSQASLRLKRFFKQFPRSFELFSTQPRLKS